jgi:hypothetical protein
MHDDDHDQGFIKFITPRVLHRLKKEKEMNKIAPVLLQKYFQVSKERYTFKEHSKIRLGTIYIHYTSTHMHILIWLYDSLYLDPRFDFTIYALQVCSSFLPTYELHISLSCRKRKKGHNLIIVFGEDPQIAHILRDLRVSYNEISEFYFENL